MADSFSDGDPSSGEETCPYTKSWVGVRFYDEAGDPLAGEPYELHKDGQVKSGSLDDKGFARVEELDKGAWRLVFPRRRSENWGRVQRPPEKWLALALLDADGQPLADEPYKVVFPDGSSTEGTLGPDGRARVEAPEAGPCRVSFPQRPDDAWRRKPSS